MNHLIRHAPPLPSAVTQASVILRRGTARSSVDLFAAYGIVLTPAPTAAEGGVTDIEFLSVAGFSGPEFSGVVVLGTSERMLRRSNNTASSSGDWMAELGNQLLGRIKNGLLREGISIHRVPPAVVRGHATSMLSPRMRTKPEAFSDNRDVVLVWTEFEPSFDGPKGDGLPNPDVLGEGEMVIF